MDIAQSMKSSVLPESWLQRMTPEQRQKHGQFTKEEIMSKGLVKAEKDLQSMIVQDLRRRGFEVCWHRTDRKSTATVGWPDVVFAHYGRAVAWEIKMPNGRLSPEQSDMILTLEEPPNGWTVAVIRSFDEYLAELHKLYLKNEESWNELNIERTGITK